MQWVHTSLGTIGFDWNDAAAVPPAFLQHNRVHPVFIGRMFGLHRPGRWLVVFICFGRCRNCMDLAGRVVGGCVDGIDLHRGRPDIRDIVPRPRWNNDTPTVRNFLFKSQFVLRGSHLHAAAASVEAQELISLRMRFKANVAADGDRHQRHLQIAPAPGD